MIRSLIRGSLPTAAHNLRRVAAHLLSLLARTAKWWERAISRLKFANLSGQARASTMWSFWKRSNLRAPGTQKATLDTHLTWITDDA